MYHYKIITILCFICSTCQTGNLQVIADLDDGLKESSAIEITENSKLFWTIEDSGNSNNLFGLDKTGNIVKNIDIENANNDDWEDLTTDRLGNIYIGDFGNNNHKRKKFTIYKILNPEKSDSKATAEIINFELPKDIKPRDFEAFFLYKNTFYIFSKEDGKSIMISIPNTIGDHKAVLIKEFNLGGKDNKITSADISQDGKTVLLLNHDKLWKLTNYKNNAFFEGDIEALNFNHNSQKEGITFINNSNVLITDEKHKTEGGNIYLFKLIKN